MRVRVHGLQVFPAECLPGQGYQRDREGQWPHQALFGESQASESEGKGA